MSSLVVGAGILIFLGFLVYWQLVLAEGTYLGSRTVAWLYDLTASRYNRLKEYEPATEARTLGLPLARRLGASDDVVVLDLATGTGRLPTALFRQHEFRGQVIGIDLSARMLEQALRSLSPFAARLMLLRMNAGCLPFANDLFDAVTMIEALEFFPRPADTLREMVRVLKPGGTLLFTIRVGSEAWFYPGKVFSRRRLERLLSDLPLVEIQRLPWEANYDQLWARKVVCNASVAS